MKPPKAYGPVRADAGDVRLAHFPVGSSARFERVWAGFSPDVVTVAGYVDNHAGEAVAVVRGLSPENAASALRDGCVVEHGGETLFVIHRQFLTPLPI
jgi:hypothetical protein